jgi:hypothetical protein
MPVKRMLISSLSGEEIPEGTGARIRIMFNDPRRVDQRADLTDQEVERFFGFTEEVKPRPERRSDRTSSRSDDRNGRSD